MAVRSAKGLRSLEAPGFAGLVRRAMAEWKVPGLAMAVVRGRSTIYARGFGLRDVRRRLPVTPQTLMPIASVTKAFTATALGILVDEKLIEWDKPVRDYLPAFRLQDPVATERVTPRDLLSHRTGLPRHDHVWYRAPLSRQEVFKRLRHLPPAKDLRAVCQYQNMMYMVAGLMIQEVTDRTWEEFVRERLLVPLGMRRSNVSVDDLRQDSDFALPYVRNGTRARQTAYYEQGAIAPAGAINSCVEDMARWIALNLNGGKVGRKRIVSQASLREVHTPAIVMTGPPLWPELLDSTYALGWTVQPYRGRRMVSHGGSIDGFGSKLHLLPEEKLGLVVLTNLEGHPAHEVVAFEAIDRLLGLEPVPWLARYRKERARQKKVAAAEKRKALAPRAGAARSARRIKDYAGDYQHPGYGLLAIEVHRGRLRAVWHGSACPMRHFHSDVFGFDFPWPGNRQLVSFFTDAEGRIDRLSVTFEPAVAPIVFRRLGATGRGGQA